jgi:hypothetical protein
MRSRLVCRGFLGVLLVGSLLSLPARGIDRAPRAASRESVQHWSFQPVRRPAVPVVRDRAWIQTEVDAFVLAKLEAAGLKPAPPADRRTLLRRVYLDLIGLPPTPQEQAAFLQDTSPDAYARVVDHLLARPQYGERWARHWLDVVRYAESNGYERDGAKPHAWRYRDYVITAFNQDKPYDRFLTEQLAGDELDDATAETQIATTFLRLGTWDDEPADPLVDRYDQLDDVLGTTATTFLGLTLRCARCHNHKFEPFPQTDYYRMLAVFEPLHRPQNDREDLDVPVGSETEVTAYRQAHARIETEVNAVQKQIDALKEQIRKRLFATAAGKVTSPPAKRTELTAEVIAAFQTEPSKRTTAQKQLIKQFTGPLDREIRENATPAETAQRDRWEQQIAAIRATRPRELPHAYIWSEESPQAPVTHVFRRGDPTKPTREVQPALPTVLVSRQPDPPRPTHHSTGRRLWLARWMTSPENPLTARVMVSRIWQHHFGQGLVASANDFGVAGQAPSHPELLDWLAAEFMASGWRLKPLHRRIVLSNTYQMGSTADPRAAAADPDGRLLGRWPQRRLEAEVVRDAALAVSGQLNSQMAGPSIFLTLPRAVLEGQSRPGDGWGTSTKRQAARRSIYIFVKRSLAVPELDLLDAPDTTSSCEQRAVSTTGPQALTFLNGEFMQQQARALADRLLREVGGEEQVQVTRAFELALCRPPRPAELQTASEFLTRQRHQIEHDAAQLKQDPARARRQALAALCLVILNTNEFVYLN